MFGFIKKNIKKQRFKKWQDAIPYLGLPIIVEFVEMPNINGNLEGITLAMSGDRVINGFLLVNGQLWDHYICKPK